MRISRVFMVTLLVFLVTASAVAAMHLRMTDSFPKQDETVTESPREVRVWFNQDISMAVSRVGVKGPGGDVEMGRAQETDDPKSFKALVGATLVPGSYTVTWRTAGDDGHVQRGEFSFHMAAAAPH